jgi:hypothetical protein
VVDDQARDLLENGKLGEDLGDLFDRDLPEAKGPGEVIQPQRRREENVGFFMKELG